MVRAMHYNFLLSLAYKLAVDVDTNEKVVKVQKVLLEVQASLKVDTNNFWD